MGASPHRGGCPLSTSNTLLLVPSMHTPLHTRKFYNPAHSQNLLRRKFVVSLLQCCISTGRIGERGAMGRVPGKYGRITVVENPRDLWYLRILYLILQPNRYAQFCSRERETGYPYCTPCIDERLKDFSRWYSLRSGVFQRNSARPIQQQNFHCMKAHQRCFFFLFFWVYFLNW